jgi:hypothetical protein
VSGVALDGQLEPSTRLGGHPGLLAETANSEERISVEWLAEQSSELPFQAVFPYAEGLGSVQVDLGSLPITSTNHRLTETVMGLGVPRISRHRLLHAVQGIVVPPPDLGQPAPQHPPPRGIDGPARRGAEDGEVVSGDPQRHPAFRQGEAPQGVLIEGPGRGFEVGQSLGRPTS